MYITYILVRSTHGDEFIQCSLCVIENVYKMSQKNQHVPGKKYCKLATLGKGFILELFIFLSQYIYAVTNKDVFGNTL